jgi:mevalonate kinase
MVLESFKASAPGSLMLLGEHAVLEGTRAIVAAINKRVQVTLLPRKDNKIVLNSALGTLETELENLKVETPFQFVLATLHYLRDFVAAKGQKISGGFQLAIDSEFTHTIGFGSSAAVTIATLLVLEKFIALPLSNQERMQLAQNIIRSIQGTASGADACAALHGGIVLFKQDIPFILERSQECFPLICRYSGYKTATSIVIAEVKQLQKKYPTIIGHLFDTIEASMDKAWEALTKKQWLTFGEIMNIHQGIMDALGVSDANLNAMIGALRAEKGVLGAKISGSGLGDCIIGIGEGNFKETLETIPVEISVEGAHYE